MNYRCYHLNNTYLAGIHSGIQSAHAQHELAMKYLGGAMAKSPYFAPAKEGYVEWATNHKTIIVLNGGMQSNLQEWEAMLASVSHPYAWASFREEEAALNGTLTNIALVLPETIYKHARQISSIVANWNGSQELETILKNADTHIYLRHADTTRDVWELVTEMYVDDDEVVNKQLYTKFDIELMSKLSKCSLMGA